MTRMKPLHYVCTCSACRVCMFRIVLLLPEMIISTFLQTTTTKEIDRKARQQQNNIAIELWYKENNNRRKRERERENECLSFSIVLSQYTADSVVCASILGAISIFASFPPTQANLNTISRCGCGTVTLTKTI